MDLEAAAASEAEPTRKVPWVRIAVSLAILGGLIYAIGPQQIFNGLRILDGTTLLLVLPVVILQVLLVTFRWRLICGALGVTVPYRRMFAIQSMSGLAGTLLPTGIGAAALRLLMTCREGVPFTKAASSILIDRLIAMAVLLLMVLLAQPVLLSWAGAIAGDGTLAWTAALVLLALVLGALLFLPALAARMTRIWSVIRSMAQEARSFSSKPVSLGASLAVAVVAQILLFVVAFLLGQGLGIELSLIHYLILMPSVAFLASLPIALGGWGVREGSLVAGLLLFQVPPEKALLLGIAIGVLSLVGLVPGALLWLLGRARASRTDGLPWHGLAAPAAGKP